MFFDFGSALATYDITFFIVSILKIFRKRVPGPESCVKTTDKEVICSKPPGLEARVEGLYSSLRIRSVLLVEATYVLSD